MGASAVATVKPHVLRSLSFSSKLTAKPPYSSHTEKKNWARAKSEKTSKSASKPPETAARFR